MRSSKTISFSAPMVRAIQDCIKKQTRRVMAVQPEMVEAGQPLWRSPANGDLMTAAMLTCPYGAVGDILRVREAVWVWCRQVADGTTPTGRTKYRFIPVGRHAIYHADHPARPSTRIDDAADHCWRLKIARFMPRWASRIELRLTGYEPQALQNVSEKDAVEEGVGGSLGQYTSYTADIESFAYAKSAYRSLWESINGSGSWNLNPWVWVLHFQTVAIHDGPMGA